LFFFTQQYGSSISFNFYLDHPRGATTLGGGSGEWGRWEEALFRPSPQTCPPRIVEVKIDVGSVAKGECLSTCPPRIVEKKIETDSTPRGEANHPQDGL
jgi:hypothetical protein